MWTRRLCRAFSKDDIYSPDVLRLLEKIGNNYADGLALDNFSIRELRKRVPPEVVERVIGKDSVLNHPDFAEFCDFADVTAHDHKLLPPHLSRPAIMLNERQVAAKRMTLDFIKAEKTLKHIRQKEFESSPTLSSDGYFVYMALVVARDPIWVLSDAKKIELKTQLLKIRRAHNLLPKADPILVDTKAKQSQDPHDQNLQEAAVLFQRGQDISHLRVPGSTHFLTSNPDQSDPHQVDYAGGYRTYLLLKDKLTQEWMFPEVQLFGSMHFSDCTDRVAKTLFKNQMQLYHLNHNPSGFEIHEFPSPTSIPRPRAFDEDVYDLYFRRLQVLFPEATEADLRVMLAKRHSMPQVTTPNELAIRGRKVFYFRSLHVKGSFELASENYTDWAWVPRPELNKFLTRERHARLVDNLL
jgi:hypothetical protein